MLSAVERKQQFAALMDNLAHQLGVRLVLDIEVTKLQGPNGPVFQSVPVMRIEADAVWPETPQSTDQTPPPAAAPTPTGETPAPDAVPTPGPSPLRREGEDSPQGETPAPDAVPTPSPSPTGTQSSPVPGEGD